MNNQELAFGRRWELNFRYVCNCLLVADADGDGDLEICAGSRDGVLCIYKFDQPEPWKITAPTLHPSGSVGGPFGLITALAVGDLFNKGMPILISISADGSCYACRLSPGQVISHHGGTDQILQPCFRQLLPSNIKGAHIGDIDGDGRCELIVALADRVVRTYRFLPCASATSSTGSSSGSGPTIRPGPPNPANMAHGTGFCCGYLVALNKWESPAQITAFSICPSNALPDSGVTVLLSQPGDKYLLLKPKLCPENDSADSLSDISVVYCAPARGSVQLQKSGINEKGHTEHRSGQKTPSFKSEGTNGKRKRRIFVAAGSNRIDFFHMITRYVTMVDHHQEQRIDYPTQIFCMTPLKVLSQAPSSPNSPNGGKVYRDLLLASDWSNNVYVCCVDSADGSSPVGGTKEEERHQRVTSMVTMKAYGPIMCFAAGYSEQMATDELFTAVSTCEEKLFVYSVRVSKILKTLGKS